MRAEDRDRAGRLKSVRAEDGSGRSLKSVRAEAAIKTVREWIRRIPLCQQKVMSRQPHISTQSSRASSRTIYT